LLFWCFGCLVLFAFLVCFCLLTALHTNNYVTHLLPARSLQCIEVESFLKEVFVILKLGSKEAHCVIHQPVSIVLQCGVGAWLKDKLVEISADLREALAH